MAKFAARTGGDPAIFAAILMIAVIAGFAPAAMSRGGEMSALYVFHGVLFFSWYLLFLLQALLARRRSFKAHRALGLTSLLLALVMSVAAVYVCRDFAAREAVIGPLTPAASLYLPVTDFLGFPLFYAAGLATRGRPAHGRLMAGAGVAMLLPATARISYGLGLPFEGSFALQFGFALAMTLTDALAAKRIHPATIAVMAWLIARFAGLYLVAPSPLWARIAALFG